MIPALLFYGSQQWKIPPENINFKQIERRNFENSQNNEINKNPTIIMPFAEKNTGDAGSDDLFALKTEVGLKNFLY